MSADQPPLLAITMGDAAGTGPEIITKALAGEAVRAVCRPLVIGDAATLVRAETFTRSGVKFQAVPEVRAARFETGAIDVLDLANIDPGKLELGKVSPQAGAAAYDYIERATELALAGDVAAIVTSAINKEALNLAGHHYDGHTGLLAALCRAPGATMMLVAEGLRVSHVSTHVPLRVAIERVRPERILKVLQLTHAAIRSFGIAAPRLAVAGLNPHAGENGLFGDEEQKFIAPAIAEARRLGLDVSGPHAGDTIFFRTLRGEFDGAVAMYHDQGHVAAKMLGLWLGVNVTLGLPIIRTSVEHGTSFDLAGTGQADPRSLLAAIKLAAAMARHRAKSAADAPEKC